MKPNFEKGGGLLSVILQDYRTKQVLMNGFMNEEAYLKTLENEVVWFYSRTKERLWKKGETSGHVQAVKDMALDCDQDALLIQVDPKGPTCHLGTQSCFGDEFFNLQMLEKIVDQKIENPQQGSYTKYLTDEGIDKILKKCGEETTEVVIAAKNNDQKELINETSDLLYHLLVLLKNQGVSLKDVETTLEERHGENLSYKVRGEIKEW
ncbi:bifunctional phosphoribosyl-AMP cyclohydrolase/phosphoribosyl-ATP diphosphatase HisIE [Salinicoccus halodurans]|uniref:Histidine biosynthesis bifunctional protein HisIE n=1 Tax=Salinicoccus halodurans TaxID=407035 RepID=A0A0F7HNA1_9STAP|nr:bifunctional phosphoribosyl-AMP cyclohydrolase/phosphoribosyl-ATP diphosphatase HisIE [Salinicoccus halodurans]AKG75118.1 phosphoribosyl-ATP pyrophosphatase [Salinicoccus halodurans]SFK66022.1 phosphoribosyl-ATP pyrophosphatase /phosphoribosyl-AMP cyclohydrolase [Salinicoccus halodurans]